jgi:SAM-dependent methyltransferase
MDRVETLRGMFDTDGFGLEIGPSYNPVMRKQDGYKVEILDWADADRLKAIHPKADIEPVDYVSGGSSIADTIPHRARYDYIVASHVIEHQPDIIGFLNDCAALLKPSGRLVLAVPDKRHSFDMLRPLSTAGQALQAHLERRIRHPVSMSFDHNAYAAARAGNIVWNAGFSQDAALIHDLATAQKSYAKAVASPVYVDMHSWFFTPSSFRLLIRDLHEIHAVVLNEVTFIPGKGPEFYVAMSASGAGCPTGRIELLREIMAELRSVPD